MAEMTPQPLPQAIDDVVLSWSGGKDSCLALYGMQADAGVRVAALVTTLTTVAHEFDRISMHGVRRELLERQAASLEIPLYCNTISRGAGNAEYEAAMKESLATFYRDGIRSIAFGDLFLQDIRQYRERLCAEVGMLCRFPIWGRDTAETIRQFLAMGFKTITTCVNGAVLDASFVGRLIDEEFLSRLPEGVDPCGENGEFHTFVFDGPNFKEPVRFEIGEVVLREGFYYADLLESV